jgi:NADH:ubiquinone oxidoreductase subunit 6 (subunit J)
MTLVFFYIMAATVIAGGLGVVLMRSTVYAALFLIMSLLGVAGIYIMLSVEFLALVQVLIYGGAVMVLIIFALVLTRVKDLVEEKPFGAQTPFALAAALALFGALLAMYSETDWPGRVLNAEGDHTIGQIPFTTIGDALFGRWAVPFEIASGVLLVALAGAIVIAMQEEGER